MKRELKEPDHEAYDWAGRVTKPIPMKRELKVLGGVDKGHAFVKVTKPIPMKRELKVNIYKPEMDGRTVTKPIPMKR